MNVFPKGSRVTFLGDSITAGNNYCSFIADYYYKNLPELQVKFACAGVSGGSATSGYLYLEPDLFPTKPDFVTIMFGVNDSNRGLLERPDSPERKAGLDRAFENYVANMDKLVDTLTAKGIKVILCTPAPYAEFFTTSDAPLVGGHALILRYAQHVRKMAKERGLDLVDFHAWLTELYLDEVLYNADHVHPNLLGTTRMAECFLSAQGLPVRPWIPNDEPAQISPVFDAWRADVVVIRSLYAVEWMVVRNYGLPYDEKIAAVNRYREETAATPAGIPPYFDTITRTYLENKAKEAELVASIQNFMDNLYT